MLMDEYQAFADIHQRTSYYEIGVSYTLITQPLFHSQQALVTTISAREEDK